MDSNAWPQIRKPLSSGLLRPVKRPRTDSSSEADQLDEHDGPPRKYAPSTGFAEMVSGLDFKLGLQSKRKGLESTRTLTTPKRLDAFKPPFDPQRSAQKTRISTPRMSNAFIERDIGLSKDGLDTVASDSTVHTPMRPPPFLSIQGGNTGPALPTFPPMIKPSTPVTPRTAQGNTSLLIATSAMSNRMPPFQLSAQQKALSTPLKKTTPFKSLPMPEVAGPSSLKAFPVGLHSVTESKDALDTALARERDKGKGKAKEMKVMSEIAIDWEDEELWRSMGNAHGGHNDIGDTGKDMHELRRGLLVSPEKGGKGTKKGRFLRGGLAESAQILISRSQTDHVLWTREIEHVIKSSPAVDPSSIHCDARLRINRVLDVRRSHSKSKGSIARTILAECEVLEAEKGSIFDVDGSFMPDGKRRVAAPPPWAPQQASTQPPALVRVLFNVAPENTVSESSALSIPVLDANPIPVGANVCVWEPWFSVSGNTTWKNANPAKEVSPSDIKPETSKVKLHLTIFCSRFLVIPLPKNDRGD